MNTKKILTAILAFVFIGLMVMPVQAQKDQKKSYDEIEKTQDDIEAMYMNIYGIIEDYPEATYEYVYDDGEVTGVVVENISDAADKRQLEVYLMDLDQMKHDIFNMTNRVGVYYVAETEPTPKNGYREFYNDLRANLTYPEQATDQGIEGTVYVKFVVDSEGEISELLASEAIDSESGWIVDNMVKQAKMAVKETSGNWNPAQVAGINVAHWVVIPVQFKLESPYYRPLFGLIDN